MFGIILPARLAACAIPDSDFFTRLLIMNLFLAVAIFKLRPQTICKPSAAFFIR